MKALLIALLLVVPVSAQNAVTATWNANPEPDIAGYRLIIDNTITDVGKVTTTTVNVAPGAHIASLLAYNTAGLVSPPSTPVPFTVAAQADPCAFPLGAHAVQVFPTSPTLTTGRPGSRSFMNYQIGGPDKVVEVAVQIDGADSVVGKGSDLAAFSGMWFTQPPVGTHTMAVRVLNAFGCSVTKAASPLIVKP